MHMSAAMKGAKYRAKKKLRGGEKKKKNLMYEKNIAREEQEN